MTAQTGKLSVVCPALNEAEGLPHFHGELCRVLAGVGDFEVIYVDDGSSDDTLSLLRAWASRDARVRYVSLSRNFGHQAAFLAGIDHARGDALVLMDSDLQHPPALIPELVRCWRSGADVVLTLRQEWRPRGLRRFASRCFSKMLGAREGRENVSDFCLLSRRAADELLRLRETHRWLRGLVQWLGYATETVAYTPAPRHAGQTKFTLGRLFSCSFDALTSFSRTPLRVPFALGVGSLAGGVGLLALTSNWTLGSVYLVGGAVLCSLGVLGEYVGRTFEQVKGRPLYLVRETDAAAQQQQDRPRQSA